jgi:hypothetical protein
MANHARRRGLVALVPIFLMLANPSWASGQGKEQDEHGVTLKTPSGGFEVSDTVKTSQIGLPVYRGAKLVTGKDRGDLAFVLSRQGKADVRFLVAKFETHDSIDQVRDFYQKKLGKEVTKFTEKTEDGGMAFEIKRGAESKYVQLKSAGGMTEIDLVCLEGVQDEDQ